MGELTEEPCEQAYAIMAGVLVLAGMWKELSFLGPGRLRHEPKPSLSTAVDCEDTRRTWRSVTKGGERARSSLQKTVLHPAASLHSRVTGLVRNAESTITDTNVPQRRPRGSVGSLMRRHNLGPRGEPTQSPLLLRRSILRRRSRCVLRC